MTDKKKQEMIEGGLERVRDAVKFLSVSRSLVYALMDRGQLPYVRLGKSRRIPRQALLDLASGNLVEAHE